MKEKTILIFGAGNIGRAFIGQVFSKIGYAVVFADIQEDLIKALNDRGGYPLVIRDEGSEEETLNVSPVRAISVTDRKAVVKEIVEADLLCTSVGKNALPHIIPLLAEGLLERRQRSKQAIDVILAENIHNGKEIVTEELGKYLPNDFPLETELGIIQASIGKMVPIVTDKDRDKDYLLVASERYNQLILDGRSFLNPVPLSPDILAVDDIDAYMDRKLYIHNLGHAVAAYLGFRRAPEKAYMAEILSIPEVIEQTRSAMSESAAALVKMYPRSFTPESLEEHIEDLLNRFQNRALGDTVFRVGRDLKRKLNRDDRLLGAILNCVKLDLPWRNIGRAFLAALDFRAVDEKGAPMKSDCDFLKNWKGLHQGLTVLCRLDQNDLVDQKVIKEFQSLRELLIITGRK